MQPSLTSRSLLFSRGEQKWIHNFGLHWWMQWWRRTWCPSWMPLEHSLQPGSVRESMKGEKHLRMSRRKIVMCILPNLWQKKLFWVTFYLQDFEEWQTMKHFLESHQQGWPTGRKCKEKVFRFFKELQSHSLLLVETHQTMKYAVCHWTTSVSCSVLLLAPQETPSDCFWNAFEFRFPFPKPS